MKGERERGGGGGTFPCLQVCCITVYTCVPVPLVSWQPRWLPRSECPPGLLPTEPPASGGGECGTTAHSSALQTL